MGNGVASKIWNGLMKIGMMMMAADGVRKMRRV